MRRVLISVLGLLLVLAGILVGAGAWWVNHPLSMDAPSTDLSIEPGTSPRGVAQVISQSGVRVAPELMYAWFRVSGAARQIKAGSYEVEQGATPRSLLRKLVRGEETLRTVTLVEGWTFRQVRVALSNAEQLDPETAGLNDEALMAKLGRPGLNPEGRFFPDTYSYSKGSVDWKLLARALRSMDKHLQTAWALRSADTPLRTPEQALVLGSIVEKETARAADRPIIAAVFTNRLRLGMMLQTDPSVIYGLGPKFDGNLRKKDLLTDTPWNTYTRPGLPPTPIAMPGRDALLAAVAPAQSSALYFVSRGDGTSEFSSSLDAHNRAVDKYQRKR